MSKSLLKPAVLTLLFATSSAHAQSFEEAFEAIAGPVRKFFQMDPTVGQSQLAPAQKTPHLLRQARLELRSTYNVRSRPSLHSKKVSTVKDLGANTYRTGVIKISRDGSKWVEIKSRNGRHGWVNEHAIIHNKVQAHAKNQRPTTVTHSTPRKPKVSQPLPVIENAPVVRLPAPKINEAPPVVKTAPPAVKEVAPAPIAQPPVAVEPPKNPVTPSNPPQREPAKPIINPTPETPLKSADKNESNEQNEVAEAPSAPAAAPKTPNKVVEAPKAATSPSISNQEDKKTPKQAEQKPKSEPQRECASNLSEFKKCPMLKEALGSDYNAWGNWTGQSGTNIVPRGRGMLLTVPELGKWFGYADTPITIEVCVDSKDKKKPYAVILGKRKNFNDSRGNSFTLEDKGQSSTFTRAGR